MRNVIKNMFVVDCETGGYDSKADAVCSITLKQFNKKKILDLYIKPSHRKERALNYSKGAFNTHGLTKTFLRENGITERQACQKIMALCEEVNSKLYFIGQNTQFDYRFIKEMFNRNGYSTREYISYHFRDTGILAQSLKDAGLINPPSFSLVALYKDAFGRNYPNPHTSLGDVKATEKLYNFYIKILRKMFV